MGKCQFPWLAANVVDKASGNVWASAITSKIISFVVPPPSSSSSSADAASTATAQIVRVGLFGVTTPETPHLSYPGDNIVFKDLVTSSQTVVDQLRRDGADIIVGVTHVSLAEDLHIANRVRGIDVLLGGHDHKPYAQQEGHTLIFKCGQNAYWLGQVDLRVEISYVGTDRRVAVYPSWSMIACRGLAHDPKCDAIIDGYQQRMADEDEKKGGVKEDPNELLVTIKKNPLITRTDVMRTTESAAGNLIADALYEFYEVY